MTRHPLSLILTLLLSLRITIGLIPSEQAGAYPLHVAPDPSALEVIAQVNALRVSSNLPPYQIDSILMTIAQSHADYISSSGVATHFSASGLHPFQRAIAAGYSVAGDLSQGGLFTENIGMGKGLTVEGVISNWRDNSLDLDTLLSPDLKDVGVGVKLAAGVTYYVLDAGALMDDSLAFSPTLPAFTPVGTAGTQGVAVATSTPVDDGTLYHIVQSNEALWSIALAYNTTVEQLKLLNGLATNDIYEGQKLLIQKPEIATATSAITVSATFGIPTSTATKPVTPSITFTATPLPTPPASRRTGGLALGAIVFIALLAASVGSWLGRQRKS